MESWDIVKGVGLKWHFSYTQRRSIHNQWCSLLKRMWRNWTGKRNSSFTKTNFKIFCILSTDLDFHFRLSGKAGKKSWVQVTAVQPGSSFGFNFGRNNYCWLLKLHTNVVYVQFQAFVAIFDTKCWHVVQEGASRRSLMALLVDVLKVLAISRSIRSIRSLQWHSIEVLGLSNS